MPLPLGRIEREYVLRILETDRPSLSVLTGGTVRTVLSADYAVSGSTIAFTSVGDIPDIDDSSRFFFRHKQRGMYFTPDSVVRSPNSLTVCIPENIYMEERESGGEGQVVIRFPLGDCSLSVSKDFPLECTLPDPDILHARSSAIERLSVKAGVSGSGPFLPYRLYAYVDGFRQPSVGSPGARSPTGASRPGCKGDERDIVLYLDHRFAMVSIRNPHRFEPTPGQCVSLRIVRDVRTITLIGKICGVLPVNESVSVVCLEASDVQPEDQRFLFEKAWGEKFRG